MVTSALLLHDLWCSFIFFGVVITLACIKLCTFKILHTEVAISNVPHNITCVTRLLSLWTE
jgi:hypothetical protein